MREGKKNKGYHRYNGEEDQWLIDHWNQEESLQDLTGQFEECFGVKLVDAMSLRNRAAKLGILQRQIIQHTYTAEENEWIRTNLDKYTYIKLAQAFNKEFGTDITSTSMIKHVTGVMGLHKESRREELNVEEEAWLLEHYEDGVYAELTRSFNEAFGQQRSEYFIKAYIKDTLGLTKKSSFRFSEEEDAWILANWDSSVKYVDFARQFSEHFQKNIEMRALQKHTLDVLGCRKHDRKHFSPEEDQWLAENIGKITGMELTERFNEIFEGNRSFGSIRNHAYIKGFLSLGQSFGKRNHRYTPQQDQWLKDSYQGEDIGVFTKAFNEHFHTEASEGSVKARISKLRIGVRVIHRFTPQEDDWLYHHLGDGVYHSYRELAAAFNRQFGLNLIPRALWDRAKRKGWLDMTGRKRKQHS